ncbi:MAG: N-6 DNA methylase [Flavobacteriales bacterium]|nr:N-6 DNA methylase [Flavobacteriales bacterium]
MSNNKSTGSYYTPKILSDFLVRHIFRKYLQRGQELSILESSCGDGQFVSSLLNSVEFSLFPNSKIDVIDINEGELKKACQLFEAYDHPAYTAWNQDYLNFFLSTPKQYSLIIGNPPYIKKGHLSKDQIAGCENIQRISNEAYPECINTHSIKNIWPAFVQANIMSLKEDGILCLVVPSEILQVKHTRHLRQLISNEFDRVEVFAFNELIFQGIQQDVVAIIGIKNFDNVEELGFSFYQVEKLADLEEPRFTEKFSNIHRSTLDKWTNYILSDAELDFIEGLKESFHPIKSYCEKAEAGIVTAANDYFILSDTQLKKHNLIKSKRSLKPILQKGSMVPQAVNFTEHDFSFLKDSDKCVNFVHIPDVPRKQLGSGLNRYLDQGELLEVAKRYKMSKRNFWYHVPGVWQSEGLFIKRSHLYPKMIVNEAGVYATDSFYRVVTKDNFNIRSLAFSFYNSLTFLLAELEGRYYGGGVLELTPNEFKNLSIPYRDNITDQQFHELDSMLRENHSIEEILSFTNNVLFIDVDVDRLEAIRKKLLHRRLKKSTSSSLAPNVIGLIGEREDDFDGLTDTLSAAVG